MSASDRLKNVPASEFQQVIKNDENHKCQQDDHPNLLKDHPDFEGWLFSCDGFVDKENQMPSI